MRSLSANRVAAISTVLGGLAAFIAGCAQVLPGAWPNYALAASGLLVKAVTVLKFLDGSQKWDALTITRHALGTVGTTSAGSTNASTWTASSEPWTASSEPFDEAPPPLNATPAVPPGEPT